MPENMTGAQLAAETLGPIDILVLEFKSTHFDGKIMANLSELVEAGTIRIIDLVIITKSQEGNVSALEVSQLSKEANDVLAPLHAAISQMLTNDDIAMIGEELDNNSRAAVMLYENTWAVKTKNAMLAANGRMLAFERIPHEIVQQSLQDMAAMGASVA
jgi:hypothetical protein